MFDNNELAVIEILNLADLLIHDNTNIKYLSLIFTCFPLFEPKIYRYSPSLISFLFIHHEIRNL